MEGLHVPVSLSPLRTKSVPDVSINLLETVSLLNKHLTEALCAEVFQAVRTTEREREWSLFALGRFWTAVTLQTPSSAGQAIDQARTGGNGLLPEVPATASAAFQRFKTL